MRSKRGKWIRETQPSLVIGSNQDISRVTRQQRNLAEKQRRDRLNGYINELARIVPLVTMATRRMDKTSILRLSAAQLRIHQTFAAEQEERQKKNDQDVIKSNHLQTILEDIGGFLLLTTGNGKILYVSPSVEQHLGHRQTDMIGHSLLLFIHPSDIENVSKQLDSKTLAVKKTASPQRCQFVCQVKEQQRSHAESSTYQSMKFTGYMACLNQRRCEEQENSSLGFVLKVFVQPLQSQICKEMSLIDAIQDEYITRHSRDGTIVFADHRLSTITGHLPHEVCGNSAYKYITSDDTVIAMFAHKMMFNNGKGIIVYRLQTRNNDYVYLQSMGYVQYKNSSLEIEYFTCINKLLTEEEGSKELQKFNDKFSPHIGQTTASSLYEIISSPQETNSLPSTSAFPEDTELIRNSISPKIPFSGTSSFPSELVTPTASDGSVSSPQSTQTTSTALTSDSNSSWERDWQNEEPSCCEYSQRNGLLLPNGKTDIFRETNNIQKRIKTMCNVEASYYNHREINGNETENLYCTDLFVSCAEKQAYYNHLNTCRLNFPEL